MASKTNVWVGNACWPPNVGTGATGRWATFGMALDDGQRFEVSAFGAVAEHCAHTVSEGTRLRVESTRPPTERTWTARGVEHHGMALTASKVEVLNPLSPVESQQQILARILSADDALQA